MESRQSVELRTMLLLQWHGIKAKRGASYHAFTVLARNQGKACSIIGGKPLRLVLATPTLRIFVHSLDPFLRVFFSV